jgi:hypothetical protein
MRKCQNHINPMNEWRSPSKQSVWPTNGIQHQIDLHNSLHSLPLGPSFTCQVGFSFSEYVLPYNFLSFRILSMCGPPLLINAANCFVFLVHCFFEMYFCSLITPSGPNVGQFGWPTVSPSILHSIWQWQFSHGPHTNNPSSRLIGQMGGRKEGRR